jgi:Histidine kinase
MKNFFLHCFLILYFVHSLQSQNTFVTIFDSVIVNDTNALLVNGTLQLNMKEDDLEFYIKNNQSSLTHYQWEGMDPIPKKIKNNYFRYTNIKGGNYNLNLGILQNDTLHKLYAIPVHVEETLFESSWFVQSIIIYIAILGFIFFYFWTVYNLRQKLKIAKVRNDISHDLHDDVGATLSSINIYLKVLEKNIDGSNPQAIKALEKIKESSTSSSSKLRDTLWSINPEHDSMQSLMSRIDALGQNNLTAAGIQYHSEKEDISDTLMSMEQRRNLFLMVKECFNNIVKHAQANDVWFATKNLKNAVEFTIKDNGNGFDQSIANDGIGMHSLQNRAKMNFFDLDIQSEIGKGTVVTIVVKEI